MDREFTRKELYDSVWSQPMKTVAVTAGISDVALAKHCRKADIPVPSRGYWARKQAGKRTMQIELPPRFPGAPDRIGGRANDHYWGSDWAEKFCEMQIPPAPTFDEQMSLVEERARKLVGKVRCGAKFEPAHPLVAKLLAHDEERRREFTKWRSSYYAPKYDAGIERRRLLIINTLFLGVTRLGCRASMSTSRYGQDESSDRDLSVIVGQSHVCFTVEPVKPKKESQKERLRLAFGTSRDRTNASKYWEDTDQSGLEDQLAEVAVEILVSAELTYRNGLVRNREWIIERKAEAEAELKRRKDEAERKARELQEKLARERIGRLLSQAKALDRANQIRTYEESARSRVNQLPMLESDFDKWALWALQEADRIDPLKNGTIAQAIGQDTSRS